MNDRKCCSSGLKFKQAVLTILALISAPVAAFAAATTFTSNSDFDLGTLDGVNHTILADQLQLDVTGTTFPVLWIANAGEDTVSKFDSKTNKEIARYRTWFGPAGQPGYINHAGAPWTGPAPSRTAVDITGNAYVLNRHFEGRSALLMKILTSGGIDRNGNGIINTSADTNGNGIIEPSEILSLGDTTTDGVLQPGELKDERVAWAVRVGPANGVGRSLCMGTDGNLWVGLFNAMQYYKVSSADGGILAGPISVPWTPYGCAVDSNGILWSASLSGILGKLNTTTMEKTTYSHSGQNYSIAVGNNKVYLANIVGGPAYIQFDPAANTFAYSTTNFSSTGISVDGDGNIITGPYTSGGVYKFNKNTGAALWAAPTQQYSETRGVIVDSENNIWQVSRTGGLLMKYNGATGAAMGRFSVGDQPYTYSDASGFAARNITSPTGTWTITKDGGPDAVWGKASWNSIIPGNAGLQVQVRTADTAAGLEFEPFVLISNGVPFTKKARFIEVEARLNASTTGESPVLKDITIANSTCDVNGDGAINKTDIALIVAVRNKPATSAFDSRDADGDGMITVNDGRACTLRCTKAGCAL